MTRPIGLREWLLERKTPRGATLGLLALLWAFAFEGALAGLFFLIGLGLLFWCMAASQRRERR